MTDSPRFDMGLANQVEALGGLSPTRGKSRGVRVSRSIQLYVDDSDITAL